MALRQWRIVEEELKKSGVVHPSLLRCIGEMYERHRVQHEQIMQLASHYGKLIDLFNSMQVATGNLAGIMEKAGLTNKMDELEGDPDETGSTHEITRRNN